MAVDADAPGRLKGPGVMEMLGGVAGAALCRTALSQAVRDQVRQLKSAVWAGRKCPRLDTQPFCFNHLAPSYIHRHASLM